MTMQLYNTLSRKIESFQPQDPEKVSLYVCGLTVYSHPHIGNWVAYIYWDILRRTLEQSGYQVEHVQNITDVGHLTDDQDAGEDKMLKGALREGKTAWQVADTYIEITDKEAQLLGIKKPTQLPRATDFISQQIDFIKQLEEKGYVYTSVDGVYFDTSKLQRYGELARLDIQGLQFGARVEQSGKKNPTDFALWKFSPSDQKRDMEWDSPWGKGFPGWHIECSAMIRELLGDTIDIHAGGIDHIPVHHTNEIAQSESVTGKPLARYWVHVNHLKVEGQKMSKSLNNIYTLQDIVDHGFSLDAFKLMILSKHYRTEGNFTWEIMQAAQNRLDNWKRSADARWQPEALASKVDTPVDTDGVLPYLQNDLDTVGAITKIDELFTACDNQKYDTSSIEKIIDSVESLLNINLKRANISPEQKDLLRQRQKARSAKDWQQSDALRDELLAQGIGLRDHPDHSIWYWL